MLGIRLPAEAEARLDRHARFVGRGKSVIVRDWILERLERDGIDSEMRRSAAQIAASTGTDDRASDVTVAQWLDRLEAEDGGYDWGPAGPPQ